MMYTRGLTFIETIVWISIFVFAMGAIVTALLSFYRANTYTIEQAQAVSEARSGIEDMVKVIREASFASDGAYPIISIDEQEMYFYSDIDSDPFIERVRFFVEGTQLKQAVTDPSGDPPSYGAGETVSIVSDDVRNLGQSITTFHYYDTNGNEITNFSRVSDVRFVTIDLIVNVSPERLPNELTLRSSATLRNIN